MNSFEKIFLKCAKNLYISPNYYTMFEFVMGTKCYYKVVSILNNSNVYEDILNNYLLSQVRKKATVVIN